VLAGVPGADADAAARRWIERLQCRAECLDGLGELGIGNIRARARDCDRVWVSVNAAIEVVDGPQALAPSLWAG
jgi:hypothetical protein